MSGVQTLRSICTQMKDAYAHALLAATAQDRLIETGKPQVVKGLTDEQITLMERESANPLGANQPAIANRLR